MKHFASVGAATSLTALLSASGAFAEVKEYQIRRMLLLQTECGVSGLEISAKAGRDRFHATCENVAHYPDGVEILCPASEDERDCTIVTQKRNFPFLPMPKP